MMSHLQNAYVMAVMAERLSEAEHARLVRRVRQANKVSTEGRSRWRWSLRLRDPLKA